MYIILEFDEHTTLRELEEVINKINHPCIDNKEVVIK